MNNTTVNISHNLLFPGNKEVAVADNKIEENKQIHIESVSEIVNNSPNVKNNLCQNSNKSNVSYFSMKNKIPERDGGVISVDLVADLYADPLDQYYRHPVGYKVFNSQQEMFYHSVRQNIITFNQTKSIL